MPFSPLLTATTSGDALELRPSGAWTAANAATLEVLSGSLDAEIDRAPKLKLDMAGLGELDTLGAWLLEKLSRRAAGHPAEIVGVADNFAGLIEEVHQVNRHNPPQSRAGRIVALTALHPPHHKHRGGEKCATR